MYGAQNGITVKSNSDSELGMRLVAYLPELHCAVDIAGAIVTEKREQSVKAHICQSNRLGYYLIKRTADASQMAAEIKTLFIRNHIYLHTDSEKDVQVLRERFLEWKYRNACKLNGKYWVSLSRVLYCFSRKFQYSTRLVFNKMKPPYASLLHGLRH